MTERRCVLEGERVGLAVLLREDLPLFTEWFQNLELTAYLRFGFFGSFEDELAWFEDNVKFRADRVTFALLELPSRRLIGSCGLFDIRPSGSASLGIAIADPSAWNKGYGTEAVRLLVEYGMFFRNLHHIKLEYVDFNARGRRAYEKAGFKEAGRLRRRFLIGGERFDEVLMDITRDEVDLSRMRALIGQLAE